MFCFVFSHFQCFVEGQQCAMMVHIKNKKEVRDGSVAVVPKTMELGCQARLIECKVLAADVDLIFP